MNIKRRDLLTGLALGGVVEAEAQNRGAGEMPVGESLYIPKPQLVEDRQFPEIIVGHDFRAFRRQGLRKMLGEVADKPFARPGDLI